MDFSGLLLFLQIISGIICAALIFGIIRSWLGKTEVSEDQARKLTEYFYLKKESAPQGNPALEKWKNIVTLFQSQDPTAIRMALIDADILLEKMITDMGYLEDSFGEKLKHMQSDNVPWVQAAWEVHLLRNKLAHEGSHYLLTDREAYRAFKIYENILFGTQYLA